MKFLILLCLAMIGCISSAPGDEVTPVNLKNGFRDVFLGENLSAINGLVREGTIQGYLTYSRPADILKLGKTPLDSISYWSWNGKIALICLKRRTSILTNEMNELTDFTNSVYGKPTEINRDASPGSMVHFFKTIWEDSNTSILYSVIMTDPSPPVDSFGHVDLSLIIKSKQIDEEIMKEKAAINSRSPTGI